VEVWKEAEKRGYHFDKSKIVAAPAVSRIQVTTEQLQLEFKWLLSKLQQRDPGKHRDLLPLSVIESHPIFGVVEGPIAEWERV
jgi:hypothetical protein